jgi:WhiB family redox-sensing transcriptional regulator
MGWQDRGACRDVTTVEFFLDKGQDSLPAKAVCQSCPVRLECLDGAVERREQTGIWGGAGGDLVRAFRRARKLRPHPELMLDDCDCPWCSLARTHFARLDLLAGAKARYSAADRASRQAREARRRCDHEEAERLLAVADALRAEAAELAAQRPPPPERFGPGASHGTRITYNRGCRCDACRMAPPLDPVRRLLRQAAA